MTDLSILIPSRNEMFLARTIQDILEHAETDIEVIAVLDGARANPPVPQHEQVNVIFLQKPIGQRAATNMAARSSRGKYVMKVDAHCAFAQGFDRVMLEDITPDVTMVPILHRLWAFDWECYRCGWKMYQCEPPVVCPDCGNENIRRKIVWISEMQSQRTSYYFDRNLRQQNFDEYTHRDEYKKALAETGLTETMSVAGSCWMMTKDKYFELDVCDEEWGFWGSQGIEVACKTWLSGGRVLVNHHTWYAHLSRPGIGFPYRLDRKHPFHAKKMARDILLSDKWDKAIHPMSWLVDKFAPVNGWTS